MSKYRIITMPAEGDAFVYTDEDTGQLMMYIGRILRSGDTAEVIPCRGITDSQLRTWLGIVEDMLAVPEIWTEGPDGWTTYEAVLVDVDEAAAMLLEAADEVANR